MNKQHAHKLTHTDARTQAHTHARTHTHTLTHTQTFTHTNTEQPQKCVIFVITGRTNVCGRLLLSQYTIFAAILVPF